MVLMSPARSRFYIFPSPTHWFSKSTTNSASVRVTLTFIVSSRKGMLDFSPCWLKSPVSKWKNICSRHRKYVRPNSSPETELCKWTINIFAAVSGQTSGKSKKALPSDFPGKTADYRTGDMLLHRKTTVQKIFSFSVGVFVGSYLDGKGWSATGCWAVWYY